MGTLEANVTPEAQCICSVISELHVRQIDPGFARSQTICKDSMSSLSLANTAILDFFRETNKKYLEKPGFAQLRSEDIILDLEFSQLHSVRRDEIGWGFHMDGCLSLCLVFMSNTKLDEYAIFVLNNYVKVEEKD
jgi:hypothetical protein